MTRIAAIQSGAHLPDWELHVVRERGKLRTLANKQYAPEKRPRPAEHRHDYKQNEMPVLALDLHKTITPDWGYPLVSPPYEGVKAFMDEQVARGCCIHVDSASLDNPDPDFSVARTRLAQAYFYEYGLPVSFIGPNAEASLRVDDRGVSIPSAPDKPDWGKAIPAAAQKILDRTYEIGKDGKYRRRKDLEPVGEVIKPKDYPDDADVPQDQPRGLSTPLIDIDLHRTIMPAWGTRRDADPDPAMVDLIQRLYAEGFSIQISCAGWNPATADNPQFAVDRAAWQRQYLRKWGIPYDRLVTKDDCDVWFDDKVLAFKSVKQVEPLIRQRLGPAVPWSSNNPINEPDAPIK